MFLDILKEEGLKSIKSIQPYLLKRTERIEVARNSAKHFFEGKNSEQIRKEVGTALGGMIGTKGKTVILGADSQTTWGYNKYEMKSKKIYEIDKFTVMAGTGDVVFVQDIVKIFETDIFFLQALKGNGTFISPNGKANILGNLVKSIMAFALYFDMVTGFLLGLYDPKGNEARLFHIGYFGEVFERKDDEKKIFTAGCGKDRVLDILDDRYEEFGGINMDKRNLSRLMRKAINHAIKHDVYCGGKPLLYLVDKNGARRVR